MKHSKYFLNIIVAIAAFEALFILHACMDGFRFSNIDGFDIISIWATVITIVFIVFSIMGMMNIDSRIKELNDTKERLAKAEHEISKTVESLKSSAEKEKSEIVKKAQEQLIKIIDKSAQRQNIFDQLTRIANIPDLNAQIKHYTEILKTKTEEDGVNLSFVHMRRGEAFQFFKRDEEAKADFEQAIKISPNEPDTYVVMGCFYVHRKKDYAKSIEYFKKAIELNPKLPHIYVNIANSYAKIGDYAEADKYYKLADDYGVESFEWYYNKALAIKDTGEDPNGEMQERYNRYCLKLNPQFIPAKINLAANLRNQNRNVEAEQVLTELINTAAYNQDFINAIIQRGECSLINGNHPGALNDFNLAYVYCPTNVLTLLRLSQLNMKFTQLEKSLQFARLGIAESQRQNDTRFISEFKQLEQTALDIIRKAESGIFVGRKIN